MKQSPWKKFHDHLVEKCSEVFYSDDKIKSYHIDSSVDIIGSNLYDYMVSNVPEFEDTDLEDEIFTWKSITYLKRFMPAEADYEANVLLSYTITGFYGSSVSFDLIRFYDGYFIISGDEEWVQNFIRLDFHDGLPDLTNLIFYLFTYENSRGRQIPIIDLRPIEFNTTYINLNSFDQLLKVFQSRILSKKKYHLFDYRGFANELSNYKESHIETFLTPQLSNQLKKIKSGDLTNDDLPGLNEIYRRIIMGWKN